MKRRDVLHFKGGRGGPHPAAERGGGRTQEEEVEPCSERLFLFGGGEAPDLASRRPTYTQKKKGNRRMIGAPRGRKWEKVQS